MRPEQTHGGLLKPSHTDVLAAEAARKQASTLFHPHLALFFFFLLFIFYYSLSLSFVALSLSLFLPLTFPLFVLAILSASHLDDYCKIKGAEKTLNTVSH